MDRDKRDRFLSALKAYVRAEIAEQTSEPDQESMGSYHEEIELEQALGELLEDLP